MITTCAWFFFSELNKTQKQRPGNGKQRPLYFLSFFQDLVVVSHQKYPAPVLTLLRVMKYAIKHQF